jgi:prepilin-type N-terminal cleavage/methylation domain-containing protein
MMRPPRSLRPRGFTLLELLIAANILVIGMLGLYLAFDTTWATYSRGQGRTDVQQNARVAMDQMARQIRIAGYFPENFTTPPAVPALANPLQVASDNALAIYGDADGSGGSNVFLFCLSQDLSNPARPVYLLRQVRGAAGLAASYTCAGGSILAEFPAASGTSLRFTYYDANGTPIPNPSTSPYALDGQGLGAAPTFGVTTQRAAVRRVLMTLTALQDVPGHEPQRLVLTSDVRLRNLTLN